MSQLERADFKAVIDQQRDDDTDVDNSGESYVVLHGVTGSQGYQYSIIPHCPVTRICPRCLMTAIHCIARITLHVS